MNKKGYDDLDVRCDNPYGVNKIDWWIQKGRCIDYRKKQNKKTELLVKINMRIKVKPRI